MDDDMRLQVLFYRTTAGTEPAREWLKTLPVEERKIIGDDLKTAQFGWPLGMPLIRKLEPELWEVRSRFPDRIARVFLPFKVIRWSFCVDLSRKRRKRLPGSYNLPDNG